VSDEHGPFITHFDRTAVRCNGFRRSTARCAELANRVPNKGMEGLTVTPDGRPSTPASCRVDEDRHRHGRHAGGWHLVVLLKAR